MKIVITGKFNQTYKILNKPSECHDCKLHTENLRLRERKFHNYSQNQFFTGVIKFYADN